MYRKQNLLTSEQYLAKINKNTKTRATEEFKHHITIYQKLNDQFESITYKKPGTSNYLIRFFVDNYNGILTITGDVGNAIFNFYGNISFWKLTKYIKNLNYFLSKTNSTDAFTDDDNDFITCVLYSELRKFYETYNHGKIPTNVLNKFINFINYELIDPDYDIEIDYDFITRFVDYVLDNDDRYDYDDMPTSKRMSTKAILWQTAILNMKNATTIYIPKNH